MAVKTETIALKVSQEEKEQIKELAAAADVTVSKFLYRSIFKKEENAMTIDNMINELKHYTKTDLMECSVNQIVAMYNELFQEKR